MFQNRFQALIKGTLILTFTGLISRIIGFFYRIFLSRTIGAEGLGIYQQANSIYILGFAITSAGILTAISRFVAKCNAKNEYRKAKLYFICGMLLSVFLSLILCAVVFFFRDIIAIHLFDNNDCAPLLGAIAFTFPLCAIHCCINGWYYGCNKTVIPSVAQLLEQCARVLFVYLCYMIATEQGKPLSVTAAAAGLIAGEAAATIFSLTAMLFMHKPAVHDMFAASVRERKNRRCFPVLKDILVLSVPLTTNKVIIHLFSIAEAVWIPLSLVTYGYTQADALSIYGVLEGMALPMIMFPSVLTNSASVLLLPEVARAQASNNTAHIADTIKESSKFCLILGGMSTVFFLSCGQLIGKIIFQNEMAGTFLIILAWICPFLYLSVTLSSILNGLGHTTANFILHLLSCALRFLFVILGIPKLGILAYLYGMLASELFLTLAMIWALFHLKSDAYA